MEAQLDEVLLGIEGMFPTFPRFAAVCDAGWCKDLYYNSQLTLHPKPYTLNPWVKILVLPRHQVISILSIKQVEIRALGW